MIPCVFFSGPPKSQMAKSPKALVDAAKLPATERSFGILFAVAANPGSNLQDIVRLSGLTKSTAHRLLLKLEALGAIDRDVLTFRYTVGRKLVHAIQQYSIEMDVRVLARPIMARLRDKIGETISLHQLDGEYLTVVEYSEPQVDIRRVIVLGRRTPVSRGATAKAILAHQSEDACLKLLRLTTSARERSSIVTQLPAIRKVGFAISENEITAGLTALSTPIFYKNKEIWGGMSASGPSFRFTKAKARSFGPLLVAAACELSIAIGGAIP